MIRAFAPRNRLQALIGFLFWTVTFQAVYFAVLTQFSLLDTAPVMTHMTVGALACAPFLIISQSMLWHQMHLQRRLSRLARTDLLTNIPNRRRFFEIAKPLLTQEGCTLLMLDVDHFKRINDKFGHSAGDVCLQQIATFLQKLYEDAPCVARLGGEEFAVFMPSVDTQLIMTRANTAAAGIRTDLPDVHGPVPVTLSVGICHAKRGGDLNRMLIHADEALYHAKAAGRSCARVYNYPTTEFSRMSFPS